MAFYDEYWKGRAGAGLSDLSLKWPKLRLYIPTVPGTTILDYGCGDGSILGRMKAINPDAEYIGFDVSRVALEEASKNLPDIHFEKIEDGSEFPIGNECVDFIFTSEVIEHVYDTKNAFSEMSRVLKPGGKILLTTPYHGLVKNILIALWNFDKHFDPTGAHIRYYTRKTLLSCLNTVNLKCIEIGYFGRFYPVPHCMYALSVKK